MPKPAVGILRGDGKQRVSNSFLKGLRGPGSHSPKEGFDPGKGLLNLFALRYKHQLRWAADNRLQCRI